MKVDNHIEALYRATGWDHLDFGSIDKVSTGVSKERYILTMEQVMILFEHQAVIKFYEVKRINAKRFSLYKNSLSQQINNRVALYNKKNFSSYNQLTNQ